jgi:hypothetical protein
MAIPRYSRRFPMLIEHPCGLTRCALGAAHVCASCRLPYCHEHWLRLVIRRDPDGRTGVIEGCVRCLDEMGGRFSRRGRRLLEWQRLGMP